MEDDQIYMSEGELTQDTEATADKILIACVAQKLALYDYKLPLSERTMIKKNALWNEVCNVMGGTKLCNYYVFITDLRVLYVLYLCIYICIYRMYVYMYVFIE